MFQGTRVWVREKEQLLPATVNSCGDGTLVVTTDYGQVRNADKHLQTTLGVASNGSDESTFKNLQTCVPYMKTQEPDLKTLYG